jgi:hypothetical protein
VIVSTLVALALVAPPNSCAPPLDVAEQARASAIADALRDAEAKATEDPEQGVDGLQAALAKADADSDIVARDSAASDARLYAQLALARSLLATERKKDAVAVIEAALATANGRELPAKLFGPSLVSLHDERSAALAKGPRGTLELRCKGACFAAIDATPVACGDAGASEHVELPAGHYRVVLIDHADPTRRTEQTIDLSSAATVTIELDNPPANVTTTPRGRGGRPHDAGVDDGGRKLPRWAGILGMAVGAAALVAGGVLVGVDGKCPDFTNPNTAGACQDVLNTDGVGYALIGVGAGAAIGFAIAFGIGEKKQKNAKQKKRATSWRPLFTPRWQ